jgi:hypothetical protein
MDLDTRDPIELDPRFHQEIINLYRVSVYARWCSIGGLWLTVGAYSLWNLRYPIELLLEHFTWAALKYGLAFDFSAAIGLFICIGTTAGVLVGQTSHMFWGLSDVELRRLGKGVAKIRQQGKTHPLWKSVIEIESLDS